SSVQSRRLCVPLVPPPPVAPAPAAAAALQPPPTEAARRRRQKKAPQQRHRQGCVKSAGDTNDEDGDDDEEDNDGDGDYGEDNPGRQQHLARPPRKLLRFAVEAGSTPFDESLLEPPSDHRTVEPAIIRTWAASGGLRQDFKSKIWLHEDGRRLERIGAAPPTHTVTMELP
ncbi:unnamed protein product, partial [Phaeothamnion confervicola]